MNMLNCVKIEINYLSISYGIKSFIDKQTNFTCHKWSNFIHFTIFELFLSLLFLLLLLLFIDQHGIKVHKLIIQFSQIMSIHTIHFINEYSNKHIYMWVLSF